MVRLGDEETAQPTVSFKLGTRHIAKMRTKDFCWCLDTCQGLVFVGYAFCYLAYVGAGGLIFMIVESTFEDQSNELASKLQVVKDSFIKKFPNVTGQVLDDFVSDLSSSGIGNFQSVNITEPKWTFSQSVFFSMTLLTTIGYGHVAPVSQVGKAICMIYTSFGIPLTIILLTACVQRLMAGARIVQRSLASRCQRFNLKPLSIRLIFFGMNFVLIGVIFFFIPAVIFSRIEENWTYIDALYFCFISLTTVGLGDYVPGRESDVPHKAVYRIGVSIYLLVGVLSLTFLMALATQCQESIIHQHTKIEKAPSKPPTFNVKLSNYGSIIEEKTYLIDDLKHHKIKRAYR